MFYRVYDRKSKGRINFKNFLRFILPRDSDKLRFACQNRNDYKPNEKEPLPFDIEVSLARLIEKEINYLTRVEILKDELF